MARTRNASRMRSPRLFAPLLLAGALGVGGTLAATSPAFAAGAGYTPTPPTPGSGAGGSTGTVVVTCTESPSGGTCTGTIGQYTVSVTIPPNSFSSSVQVVITDHTGSEVDPGGCSKVLTAFGVTLSSGGTTLTSYPAVPVTVAGPGIVPGVTLYSLTGTSLSAYQSSVSSGRLSFTAASNGVFEVATPTTCTTSATTVHGATVVVTGKPFIAEGALAAALVLGGGLLLVAVRRRRTA